MSVEKLAAVWPEWKVVELLGEGSFGKVYKVALKKNKTIKNKKPLQRSVAGVSKLVV